jgi:hypothetical protein
MPDEQSQAALTAAFRQTVDDAIAWATTEGKRNQVMNALYDILNPDVDTGDEDVVSSDAAVFIYSTDDADGSDGGDEPS